MTKQTVSDEVKAPECCEDWPVQSRIISDCIVRESLRHGNDVYANAGGKQFIFCPWCGRSRADLARPSLQEGAPDGFRNRVLNRNDLKLEDYYFLERLITRKEMK